MGGSAALRLFVMPALKPLLEKVGAAAVVPFLFGSDKLPDEVEQDLIKKMEAAKNAANPYDGDVWATSNDKSSFGKKVDAYSENGSPNPNFDPDDEDEIKDGKWEDSDLSKAVGRGSDKKDVKKFMKELESLKRKVIRPDLCKDPEVAKFYEKIGNPDFGVSPQGNILLRPSRGYTGKPVKPINTRVPLNSYFD